MVGEKKAKAGDKGKCKFRGRSNSLSTSLSTFQDAILHLQNEKQPQGMAFSLWWAHSFSPNTSTTLSLSLESYQSVSHNLWCLTSNSSSCFPKAIAAFTLLAANQSLRSVRSPTAFSASQPSSSSRATPPLTSDSLQESAPPALLCSWTLGWSLTKLFSCNPAVLIALFPIQCHTKDRKEKTQFQCQCEEWHFKEVYSRYLYDIPHSCSEISFTLWCNYSIFMELLGAIPYSFAACRVQQNPHCLHLSWASPCSPP